MDLMKQTKKQLIDIILRKDETEKSQSEKIKALEKALKEANEKANSSTFDACEDEMARLKNKLNEMARDMDGTLKTLEDTKSSLEKSEAINKSFEKQILALSGTVGDNKATIKSLELSLKGAKEGVIAWRTIALVCWGLAVCYVITLFL